ncbi:hypothetical protein [Streptomyces sp. 4F14]|uniref:hypothetical protein n=1 Tax=Streptomyces sp. 4F14 TaxID=3394380 RepID=UPI003A88A0DF
MTTPAGEAIPVDWICVRDSTLVDAALKREILAELAHHQVGPQKRIALVAREIAHANGYELTGLPGNPLLLVAETYRGSGGEVNRGGLPGTAGVTGPAGTDGQGLNGRSGGPGGPGGDGTPGLAASEITVLARDTYQRLDTAEPGRYRALLAQCAYRTVLLLLAAGRCTEALPRPSRPSPSTRNWPRPNRAGAPANWRRRERSTPNCRPEPVSPSGPGRRNRPYASVSPAP